MDTSYFTFVNKEGGLILCGTTNSTTIKNKKVSFDLKYKTTKNVNDFYKNKTLPETTIPITIDIESESNADEPPPKIAGYNYSFTFVKDGKLLMYGTSMKLPNEDDFTMNLNKGSDVSHLLTLSGKKKEENPDSKTEEVVDNVKSVVNETKSDEKITSSVIEEQVVNEAKLNEEKRQDPNTFTVTTDKNGNNRCWINAPLYAIVIPDKVFAGGENPNDNSIAAEIYKELKNYKLDRSKNKWNEKKWVEFIELVNKVEFDSDIINSNDYERGMYTIDINGDVRSGSYSTPAPVILTLLYVINKYEGNDIKMKPGVIYKEDVGHFSGEHINYDNFSQLELEKSNIISIVNSTGYYDCNKMDARASHFIAYTKIDNDKYIRFDAIHNGTSDLNNTYNIKQILSVPELTIESFNKMYSEYQKTNNTNITNKDFALELAAVSGASTEYLNIINQATKIEDAVGIINILHRCYFNFFIYKEY